MCDLLEECRSIFQNLFVQINRTKDNKDFGVLFEDYFTLRKFLLVELESLIADVQTMLAEYILISTSNFLNVELARERFHHDVNQLKENNKLCARIKIEIENFYLSYLHTDPEAIKGKKSSCLYLQNLILLYLKWN